MRYTGKHMKVMLIRNALRSDFGGAERLVVHMASELQQHGIEAVVVSRHKQLLAYAAAQGVTTHRGWWWSHQNWSGWRVLLFPVYLLWQLLLLGWYLQLLLRLRPNVVHIQSKDDFIAGTLAAWLLGKRVIWTDPADLKHIFANHSVWYKNPIGKLVYWASRHAAAITLVSRSEAKLVAQALGKPLPERFMVVHIAGKQQTVEPLPRTTADAEAVIFCATSRLVIAKGIGELIEAFLALSETSDNYRLWLVGDGPDAEQFKQQAGGNSYINFIGHSDTPLRYLAAADVFVQPTYHEGFSLALAEAAMLGKPMIATNVGGNPELVNTHNGILVPAQDVPSLLTAMEKLGSNAKLRQQLGQQARKDYQTDFDFSHIMSERFIPLYGQTS